MNRDELKVGQILRRKEHLKPNTYIWSVEVLSIKDKEIKCRTLHIDPEWGKPVEEYILIEKNLHQWQLSPEYAAKQQFDKDLEELIK